MQVPWNHSHSTMHQGTSVLVELILESSRWSSALPAIQLANIAELQASPIPIHLSQLPTLLRFGQTPSRPTPSQLLCAMIPVVLFASPYALCSWYSCSVFSHGTELPVHTERVLLVCIACPPQSTGWIYTSTLAPGFWRALCSASCTSRSALCDLSVILTVIEAPTQYSIVQQVVPLTRTTTISIIYSLSYPEPFKKSENIETNQNIINDGILQPAHDYSVRHISFTLYNLRNLIDTGMICALCSTLARKQWITGTMGDLPSATLDVRARATLRAMC